MTKCLKKFLKFHILPKALYLKCSAMKKYARSEDKGESEIKLLPFLVDRQRAAIDVGANAGLYTYFMSKLCKKVYAFEPHEQLANFLKKATNENVDVINAALSDQAETRTFYTPIVNGKESLNIASLDEKTALKKPCAKTVIETKVLDNYQFDDIGFIKIDVEGHELEVLKGARETIKRCRPVILIEILPGETHIAESDVVQFMQEQDYGVFYLNDNVLKTFSAVSPEHSNRNFIFLPQK